MKYFSINPEKYLSNKHTWIENLGMGSLIIGSIPKLLIGVHTVVKVPRTDAFLLASFFENFSKGFMFYTPLSPLPYLPMRSSITRLRNSNARTQLT